MAPLPTVLLIPGAGHTVDLYEPFRKALESRDLTTITIPLPSIGACPGLEDSSQDVEAVREVVSGLVQAGTDVYMILHSYGGIPGSAAVKDLGKMERAVQGKPHGVMRLVYLAAWVLDEGTTIPFEGTAAHMANVPGHYYNDGVSRVLRTLVDLFPANPHRLQDKTLFITEKIASEQLFHDVKTGHAEIWASKLTTQSMRAVWSPQGYAGWRMVPSAYIITENDRVIAPALQKDMIEKARQVQPLAFDIVKTIDCGHEPQVSRVKELADLIIGLVKGDIRAESFMNIQEVSMDELLAIKPA